MRLLVAVCSHTLPEWLESPSTRLWNNLIPMTIIVGDNEFNYDNNGGRANGTENNFS